MSLERRRAPRFQFVADAEVAEGESRAKFMAKTGDLSIGSCFLDMLDLSVGGIEIQGPIDCDSHSFTARGRVVFVIPRRGVGVAFTRVDPGQLPILEEWIAGLESSRTAALST